MPQSLKAANKRWLLAVMLANLAVYYTAVETDYVLLGGDWLHFAGDWTRAWPAGVGLVITGILNAQLGADSKCRLVFWRWSDPLPGCRAFSKLAARDPRVDLGAVERAHGPLPTDPRQQNALWYRLYKSVGDDPSVSQVHREFLFARDYTCVAFFVLIVFGTAGFFEIPSTRTALWYLAVLIGQYLLVSQAARVHGRRFVTTVLALKGAGA